MHQVHRAHMVHVVCPQPVVQVLQQVLMAPLLLLGTLLVTMQAFLVSERRSPLHAKLCCASSLAPTPAGALVTCGAALLSWVGIALTECHLRLQPLAGIVVSPPIWQVLADCAGLAEVRPRGCRTRLERTLGEHTTTRYFVQVSLAPYCRPQGMLAPSALACSSSSWTPANTGSRDLKTIRGKTASTSTHALRNQSLRRCGMRVKRCR